MEFAPPSKQEHDRLIESILNNNSIEHLTGKSDHEDLKTWPMGEVPFGWEELNQDFGSQPYDYRTVSEIASDYRDENMDLRLCMIERPFTVSVQDPFPKVLNLFR